jgi:hypothetical protein
LQLRTTKSINQSTNQSKGNNKCEKTYFDSVLAHVDDLLAKINADRGFTLDRESAVAKSERQARFA